MTNNFPSWVEISLDNLNKNLQLISKKVGHSKVAVVVKSNAYGHGFNRIIKFLNGAGVEYIAVGTPLDALKARQIGFKGKIILLYEFPIRFYSKKVIIDPEVIVVVGSRLFASQLDSKFRKLTIHAQVHIEINVGIGKSGINSSNACEEITSIINDYPSLNVSGLMAHLPDTDSQDTTLTFIQVKNFYNIVNKLRQKGYKFESIHLGASTAAITIPASRSNLVRIGAAIYGLQSSNEKKYPLEVIPALTWKTRLTRVRDLKQGDTIGYGLNRLKNNTKIGIIPVGYALGLHKPHQLNVLISGKACRLMGVNMTESYVDLTNDLTAAVGSEVTLIGPDEPVSAQTIARQLNTVSENIITSISELVPKYYL